MRMISHSVHRGLTLGLFMFALAGPALAEVKTREITYQHEGTELTGLLAWDDAQTGKRPGVLVVHEWWGRNEFAKNRAIALAKLGYVGFALDMYGTGKVTNEPVQAKEWAGTARSDTQKWRARALAGLDVLKQQPETDGEKLAAIGYCFGGSTVVQMAYAGAPVRGVVSFHGALTPPIAGETVTPEVLVCTGAMDTSIPAAQIEAFAAGMEEAKAKYTILVFGGARHSFTNPKAGEYGIENIAYQATADRRSWANMKLFFKEIFAK